MSFSYQMEKTFIEESSSNKILEKRFFTTATFEGLSVVTFQTE